MTSLSHPKPWHLHSCTFGSLLSDIRVREHKFNNIAMVDLINKRDAGTNEQVAHTVWIL